MSYPIDLLFRIRARKASRYERHLAKLRADNRYTFSIETTINAAMDNIEKKASRSFVIYGEPQSGKTEMMLALTARLLDSGFRVVIVLLNDCVQLLEQNLARFRKSGLDPTPRSLAEILSPTLALAGNEWVIFCKKNPQDLVKLSQKLKRCTSIVVIDDEADFASPNARVQKRDRTRINGLITRLLSASGIYIAVTATPARLDLNCTLGNEHDKWIEFPPHPAHKGQDTFFPLSPLALDHLGFRLTLIPDTGDNKKYLRDALLSFLVNVAYLNLHANASEKNYSALIHTSGKRADHAESYSNVEKIMNSLTTNSDMEFGKALERIWRIASERYLGIEGEIAQYILDNRNRYLIVVMNSALGKQAVDFSIATDPAALFTITIGGNIVSRGVTFNNLLSMYFSRSAKHKLQQDTYIQRARMFGTRGDYLKQFELTVPRKLYFDWHRCFFFHKLALSSSRSGDGSRIWIEDERVAAVAPASIDRASVSIAKGEVGFEMFDYDETANAIVESTESSFVKLERLAGLLENSKLPTYFLEYLRDFCRSDESILAIHPAQYVGKYKDADHEKISRAKPFIGMADLQPRRYPNALHHVKIVYNETGRARIFYRYAGRIMFLRNPRQAPNATKHDRGRDTQKTLEHRVSG